jgi:hypothetical protein
MLRIPPHLLLLGAAVAALPANSAFADVPAQQVLIHPHFVQNSAFPLTPRLSGMGLFGDDQTLSGDAMAALWGNQNHIVYMNLQAKTAFDTDWLASLGTGFRGIVNDKQIFGAYLFVDRTISPYNNEFWFVSPGIETLGQVFDFHANGYFPTSSKRQYGTTDWADNFGVYDFVTFQGHNQFDILMTQDEEVGWGADAEIGANIPGTHNIRIYAGGYHFNFDNADDINGAAGRLEIPVNRFLAVTARDSYDNIQHNTFMAGVRLTLGGVNEHPRDTHQAIQERLLDPIERNMATLGQGAGEPIQKVLTPLFIPLPPTPPSPPPVPPTPPGLERDNIWFFSPTATGTFDGTINACTAENPCISTDFTQATIDGINTLKATDTRINNFLSSSPSFYLAPADYEALFGTVPLQFTNDWLWGRTPDFSAPLLSATLHGALLFDGTNNLIDHIILYNSLAVPQNIGVTLNEGSTLTLNTSKIGEDPNQPRPTGIDFMTAIQMQDAVLQVMGGSEINAFATNAAALGINAVDVTSGSTINVLTSVINVLSSIDDTPSILPLNNLIAAGIRTNDSFNTGTIDSSITLIDSQINSRGTINTEGPVGDFSIMGISQAIPSNNPVSTAVSTLELDHSGVLTEGTFNTFNGTMTTVGVGIGGGEQNITLINGQIIVNDLNGSGEFKNVYGLWLAGNGDATLTATNDSNINTSLTNSQSTTSPNLTLKNAGIFIGPNEANANISFTDSHIVANTDNFVSDSAGVVNIKNAGLMFDLNSTMQDLTIDLTRSTITALMDHRANIGMNEDTLNNYGIATPSDVALNNFSVNMNNSSIAADLQFSTGNYSSNFINDIGIFANASTVNLTMLGTSLVEATLEGTIDNSANIDPGNITAIGVNLYQLGPMTSNITLNDSSQIHTDYTLSVQQTLSLGNNNLLSLGITSTPNSPGKLTSVITLNDNSQIKAESFFDVGNTIENVTTLTAGINLNSNASQLDSTINLNGSAAIHVLGTVDVLPLMQNVTFLAYGIANSSSYIPASSTATINLADNSLIDVSNSVDAGGAAFINTGTTNATGIYNGLTSLNSVFTVNSDSTTLIQTFAQMDGFIFSTNAFTQAYGINLNGHPLNGVHNNAFSTIVAPGSLGPDAQDIKP